MKKLFYLVFSILLGSIFSCSDDFVEPEKKVEASTNQRIMFENRQEMNHVIDELNRMSLSEQKQWVQTRQINSCINEINVTDTTLHDRSNSLKAVLNKELEFQINDSVMWYNNNTIYFLSDKNATSAELKKLKQNPQLLEPYLKYSLEYVETRIVGTGSTTNQIHLSRVMLLINAQQAQELISRFRLKNVSNLVKIEFQVQFVRDVHYSLVGAEEDPVFYLRLIAYGVDNKGTKNRLAGAAFLFDLDMNYTLNYDLYIQPETTLINPYTTHVTRRERIQLSDIGNEIFIDDCSGPESARFYRSFNEKLKVVGAVDLKLFNLKSNNYQLGSGFSF